MKLTPSRRPPPKPVTPNAKRPRHPGDGPGGGGGGQGGGGGGAGGGGGPPAPFTPPNTGNRATFGPIPHPPSPTTPTRQPHNHGNNNQGGGGTGACASSSAQFSSAHAPEQQRTAVKPSTPRVNLKTVLHVVKKSASEPPDEPSGPTMTPATGSESPVLQASLLDSSVDSGNPFLVPTTSQQAAIPSLFTATTHTHPPRVPSTPATPSDSGSQVSARSFTPWRDFSPVATYPTPAASTQTGDLPSNELAPVPDVELPSIEVEVEAPAFEPQFDEPMEEVSQGFQQVHPRPSGETQDDPMDGVEFTTDFQLPEEESGEPATGGELEDDPMGEQGSDSDSPAPIGPRRRRSKRLLRLPPESKSASPPRAQSEDEEDPDWLDMIFAELPNGARFKPLTGFECDSCVNRIKQHFLILKYLAEHHELSPASTVFCHFQVNGDGELSACKSQLRPGKASPKVVTDCRRCSFQHPYPPELVRLAESIIQRLRANPDSLSASLLKDIKFLLLALANPHCERHWPAMAGGHIPDGYDLNPPLDDGAHRWLRPSSIAEVLNLGAAPGQSQASSVATSRFSARARTRGAQSLEHHLNVMVLEFEAPPADLLDPNKSVKEPSDLCFAFEGQTVRGPYLSRDGRLNNSLSPEVALARVRVGCVLLGGPPRCSSCRLKGTFCAHLTANLFGSPAQRSTTRPGSSSTAALPCGTCSTGPDYCSCEHASASTPSARRLQFLIRMAGQLLVMAARSPRPSAELRESLTDWCVFLRDYASGQLAPHFKATPDGHFLELPKIPSQSPSDLRHDFELWPRAPWVCKDFQVRGLEFFGPSITSTLHNSATGLALNGHNHQSRDEAARSLPSGSAPSRLRFPGDFVQLFQSSDLPPF